MHHSSKSTKRDRAEVDRSSMHVSQCLAWPCPSMAWQQWRGRPASREQRWVWNWTWSWTWSCQWLPPALGGWTQSQIMTFCRSTDICCFRFFFFFAFKINIIFIPYENQKSIYSSNYNNFNQNYFNNISTKLNHFDQIKQLNLIFK